MARRWIRITFIGMIIYSLTGSYGVALSFPLLHHTVRAVVPGTERSFRPTSLPPQAANKLTSRTTAPRALLVRGGQSAEQGLYSEQSLGGVNMPDKDETLVLPTTSYRSSSLLPPVATSNLAALAGIYTTALERSPILTKSITASCIMALSDYLAQLLEARRQDRTDPISIGLQETNSSSSHSNGTHAPRPAFRLDRKRLGSAAAIGLLYFGPAAHYWYNFVFFILPETTLVSTLLKAILGQLIFGPAFMSVFFAASLWQSGQLTPTNWVRKMRQDLPGAWLAGAGYWPLIDLISYSFIPRNWIPLFVNLCSLVWTIYLSMVANRKPKATSLSAPTRPRTA